MRLDVTVEQSLDDHQAWLITLAGELDYHSAGRFRGSFEAVSPPRGHDVLLDLGGLQFLDSAGLAAIVGLYLQLEDSGTRLAVVAGSRHIQRMFRIRGVHDILRVFPTQGEAMAALQNGR